MTGEFQNVLFPMVAMFIIFYFLVMRPQNKKLKEHKEMIANLKKGDKVITSGGIHGTVTKLDDAVVTIEISDKVRMKVTRTNISVLQ